MYTTQYIKHQEDMKVAQINFDKNPCKETATKLSNLRQNVPQMYTNEELEKRKTMRQRANENFWMEMSELVTELRTGKFN